MGRGGKEFKLWKKEKGTQFGVKVTSSINLQVLDSTIENTFSVPRGYWRASGLMCPWCWTDYRRTGWLAFQSLEMAFQVSSLSLPLTKHRTCPCCFSLFAWGQDALPQPKCVVTESVTRENRISSVSEHGIWGRTWPWVSWLFWGHFSLFVAAKEEGCLHVFFCIALCLPVQAKEPRELGRGANRAMCAGVSAVEWRHELKWHSLLFSGPLTLSNPCSYFKAFL